MKYVLWFLVLILVVVIVSTVTARFLFAKKAKAEVKELYKNADVRKSEVVTKEDLKDLPVCVQKWLESSQVVGKEKIRTVRLKQKGLMRTEPQKPWMPFEAEQYFNVERPGFIWFANVKAAPLTHIAGRDKYYEGKGNMLIKIMSLIKVADGVGEEMDQGALARYLSETMWFPTAALNDYIKWESIDDRSARATMTYQGVTASGVFVFDQQGNPVSFSAKRYRNQGGKFTLDDWYTPVHEYKEFNGIRIPAEGEAIWKLPAGDFSYIRLEITEIEYNKPFIY